MAIMITKALLLAPLILVILISGCTWFNGNGTTGESNVLVIESLTGIPNTIQAGQSVMLVAIIKNQGSENVPQSGIGNGAVIKTQLYNYCPGLFKLPTDQAGITCDSVDGQESSQGSGFDICEFTTSLSINEKRQIDWTLKQEPDAQVTTTCEMSMSTLYPYETTGLTTIHLINSDELQRQIAEGTYQSKNSNIGKGEGPIKVWFEVVSEQPVSVVRKSEGAITLALHIEDKGTGNPWHETHEPRVTITDIKLAWINGANQIEINDDSCNEITAELFEPKLIQGNYEKTCNAKIIGGDDSITDFPKESTVHATVTVQYMYEVTKDVNIKVEPEAA